MHISLKTGHQVLPKKIWLPFIRKANSYIQLPGSEAQGFALPGTVRPRLSRLHTHCLSGTTYHKFSTVFHSFQEEWMQWRLTKAYIDCFSVQYHSGPFFQFSSELHFYFENKQKLKVIFIKARQNDESRSSKFMKVKYI